MVQGLDVFKTTEALGLPLDFLLFGLDEKNHVVDWVDFVNVALDHGWSMKTVLTKLEYPIIDVYGKVYWDEIKRRLLMAIERGLINIQQSPSRDKS